MTTIPAAGQIGPAHPPRGGGVRVPIALLSFGPRSAIGQFLAPLSLSGGWGRDVFSFAIALQNLLWGAGQPFAGAVADRFGANRGAAPAAPPYTRSASC